MPQTVSESRLERIASAICPGYGIYLCSCGSEKEILDKAVIRKGGTKSCGCLARELSSDRALVHGGNKTSEYYTYWAMIQRCTNPKTHNYSDYGGRGIRVCDRWFGEEGFQNFLEDMGERPSSKHSLDRFPNNNGNYEPGNCRWATVKQQARNRRSSKLITWNGKTQTISEWAEELNLNQWSLGCRFRRGWSVEKALTTRVR